MNVNLPADHPAVNAIRDALYEAQRDVDDAGNRLSDADNARDTARQMLSAAELAYSTQHDALLHAESVVTQLQNALHLLGN